MRYSTELALFVGVAVRRLAWIEESGAGVHRMRQAREEISAPRGRRDAGGSILTVISVGTIGILRAGPGQEVDVRGDVAVVEARAVVAAVVASGVGVDADRFARFLVNNGTAGISCLKIKNW